MTATYSPEELSTETGVSLDRLEWMQAIGILKPADPERFTQGDRFRVNMIAALLNSGITPEQLGAAASDGSLNLDHVDHYLFGEEGPRSDRTFAEFAASLGPRASDVLPVVFQVLGLPEPDPSSGIHVDEEALLEDFFLGWALAGDNETLIRAARLMGEGVRLPAVGWGDLLDETIAGPARERFLRGDVDTYPAEVIGAVTRLIRLQPRLMTWLVQRYVEQGVVAGIVENFEAVLASRGFAPPPEPRGPPAVVFVDLSGYTSATEQHGDEAAVRLATSLQERAEDVVGEPDGRVVKLLGDGAMLYFREPTRAVAAAVELVAGITTDVGLAAHAGVHTGSVIERDRDLFGRTVNLASRIAATAGPGEVIASEAVIRAVRGSEFRFERLDDAIFKGVEKPVPRFRVRLPAAQS